MTVIAVLINSKNDKICTTHFCNHFWARRYVSLPAFSLPSHSTTFVFPLRSQLWWWAVASAAATDCCSCRHHERSRRCRLLMAAPARTPWSSMAPVKGFDKKGHRQSNSRTETPCVVVVVLTYGYDDVSLHVATRSSTELWGPCPCGHDPPRSCANAHGPPKSTPTRSQCQRLLRGQRQGHHARASSRMKRSTHHPSKSETRTSLLNGDGHGMLCH